MERAADASSLALQRAHTELRAAVGSARAAAEDRAEMQVRVCGGGVIIVN